MWRGPNLAGGAMRSKSHSETTVSNPDARGREWTRSRGWSNPRPDRRRRGRRHSRDIQDRKTSRERIYDQEDWVRPKHRKFQEIRDRWEGADELVHSGDWKSHSRHQSRESRERRKGHERSGSRGREGSLKPREQQSDDSTIATVTVFLNGDEANVSPHGIHSSESQGSPGSHHKRKRHHVKKVNAARTGKDSPSIYHSKSKSRSRERRRRSNSKAEQASTVTVFDLADPSRLPPDIIDLLECTRCGLCVHDHTRCKVVNNKLYITSNKPIGEGRHQSSSPVKRSQLSDSSSTTLAHRATPKKAIFPEKKRRRSSSRGGKSSRQPSASPALQEVRVEETNPDIMPPPPRGYHVRKYQCNEDCHKEDGIANSSAHQPTGSFKDAIKSAVAKAAHTKRHHTQESNKSSKKIKMASPRHLAKSIHTQIKKLGFDSDYIVMDGKPKNPPREKKDKQRANRDSAVGDSISKGNNHHFGTKHTTKGIRAKADQIEKSKVFEADSPSEYTTDLSNDLLPKSLLPDSNKPNKSRMRQTRREKINVNNSHLAHVHRNMTSSFFTYSRELITQVDTLDMSPGYHLNVNTNALEGDESSHVEMEVSLSDKPAPSQTAKGELKTKSAESPYVFKTNSTEVAYEQEGVCVEPGAIMTFSKENIENNEIGIGADDGISELQFRDPKSNPANKPRSLISPPTSRQPVQKMITSQKSILRAGEPAETVSDHEVQADGWETKKHSIMAACNEAIQNHLSQQGIAETDPRDTPISDKSQRKKKATDSVYLKFKSSTSQKTTTTTTLKEVKQITTISANGTNVSKEVNGGNSISLQSQNSDQILAVRPPRYTRIMKCEDQDNFISSRKLGSDTDVEHLRAVSSNKHLHGPSKLTKETLVRDQQGINMKHSNKKSISKEVVNKPSTEKISHVPDNKLPEEIKSESVSATTSHVTVIEQQPDSSQKNVQSDENVIEDMSGHDQLVTENGSKSNNLDEVSVESSTSKKNSERSRKKSKSCVRGQKSQEFRKTRIKACPSGVTSKQDCPHKRQSVPSLIHTPKSSSSSIATQDKQPRRTHSSPPEGKKNRRKLKKKQSDCSLTDESPTNTKSNKDNKSSQERKKKKKSNRDIRPRKKVSTCSSSSVHKKKSSTTTLSVFVASAEVSVSQVSAKTTNSVKITPMTAVRNNPTQDEPAPGEMTQESERVKLPGSMEQKTIQHSAMKNLFPQSVPEPTGVQLVDAVSNAANQSFSEQTGAKSIDIGLNAGEVTKPLRTVIEHKVGPWVTSVKPVEKDLQRAEKGWNSSLSRRSVMKEKIKDTIIPKVSKKPKLKYIIVKAKDPKKEDKKSTKNDQPKTCLMKSKDSSKPKVTTKGSSDPSNETEDKCIVKERDVSPKSQGKTVQFSQSTENLESTEQEGDTEKIKENATEEDISEGVEVEAEETVESISEIKNDEVVAKEEESKKKDEKSRRRETSGSPRRQRRPMWLKKATVKQPEAPAPVIVAPVSTLRTYVPPAKLEKKREYFEEIPILQPEKCNIQVTYPLAPVTNTAAKANSPINKTKVAYTAMLRDIFMALPLKKSVKRVIAQAGSPVDIKETTEGSSVDAMDYAKALNLKYPSRTKRIPESTVAPAALSKKKKGVVMNRSPIKQGQGFVTSELERKYHISGCSSTDLDELAALKFSHSAHLASSSISSKLNTYTKERGHGGSGVDRESRHSPRSCGWHCDGSSIDPDDSASIDEMTWCSEQPMGGAMSEHNVLSRGLAWFLQGFFQRFNFLNPRRPGIPVHYRSDLGESDHTVSAV